MIAYLDTNVAVRLAQGSLDRISKAARQVLEIADLLISPIAILELQYLYEIERTTTSSRDMMLKLEREVGLRTCDLPFGLVASIALQESWTRDPFDRLIVAQAKANGLACLVSSDTEIRKHYPRALW